MTKLDEVLEARAASRARVLELRKDLADKSRELVRLEQSVEATDAAIKRERAKLIDLTNECGRLLHADLAGVAGKDASTEPEAAL